MVSVLDSGLSSPGSSPGRDIELSVLCFWARHYSHSHLARMQTLPLPLKRRGSILTVLKRASKM